jgi:hypothetical protein
MASDSERHRPLLPDAVRNRIELLRDLAGEAVSDGLVRHVYTFSEGLVTHVAIREHK